MFNKETGKRQFRTFHGNSCKEGKNGSSVTRKKLQPLYKNCIYMICMTYSAYLEPHKYVIFGLQLCPINQKNCRGS